jgi:predicted amidophosphoribosyltransferase
MIIISPKKIKGEWNTGYALDFHTLSSEYLGHDAYGHPQYDTKRSDMGEMLYRLKYKSDKSVLRVIVDTTVEFINNQEWLLDLIIPVPYSLSTRIFQPVITVAKSVSKCLGIKICTDCIVKIKEIPELKNIYDFDERMKVLKNAYAIVNSEIKGRNVLLFDDLYRSGATLNAITQSLKEYAKEIYVITLTKTRKIT